MPEFVNDFKNILEKNRVNVTIRREMGRDINAAWTIKKKEAEFCGKTGNPHKKGELRCNPLATSYRGK